MLCYAAGLLSGFGGVLLSATIAVALVLGWSLLARRTTTAACAALAAAGLLVSAARMRDEQLCIRSADGFSIVAITALEPGGVKLRALAGSGACRSTASVTIATGRLAAGDRVHVVARAQRVGRTLVLRDARVVSRHGNSGLVRLRWRSAERIRRLYRDRAPVVLALLVADTRDIAPEVRDRYAAAGLVHMLSISGLHVALVAEAVLLAFGAARLPRRTALIAAAALTAAYVAMIGAPAPAVRAAMMLAAVGATRLIGRPTSPWASLALGALLPLLLDARAIVDLGYQLSVLGIASLAGGAALVKRLPDSTVHASLRRVGRDLLASTIAVLASAPLIAWHFGELSLVAPLSNLAAAPVVALLQPALFLSLVVPVDALAALVADGAGPLLAAFDTVARIGAGIPHAAVQVTPSTPTALLLGGASVACLIACSNRFPTRPALVAGACMTAAVWAPSMRTNRQVELHMIDVGQGDAVALRTPRGRWVLMDAGREWQGGDAGRKTVLPYLRRRGGALVAFVLSHPHADHAGGAASVIERGRPALYVDAGYPEPSGPYIRSLASARRTGTRWVRARPGDSLAIDGVVVHWLAPDSTWAAGLSDPNDASTVALVTYGRVRFLLTGDAEAPEEGWLLAHARHPLRADVLKVAHHGSRTSTTPAFLAAVAPRVALVSVGAGNVYRLPNSDVLDRLSASGAEIHRTDEEGSIVVRTDGAHIEVAARGERHRVPARRAP